MLKIGRIEFLLSVLFVAFTLVAGPTVQAVEVQASVDRNQMAVGDSLILTIAVSSGSGFNLTEPRLPSLRGLQLINRWTGSESRSTFANGKFQTRRTQKFNYQLAATQKGSVTIGSAEVVVGGQSFKTKPIRIKVLAGGSLGNSGRQAQRGQRRQRPFQNDPFSEMDDIFNQLLGRRQGSQGAAGVNVGDAVFIGVDVDKKEVYQGEQVTASWYLYTRAQIRDIDTLKYPSLNGFWKEDIEVATHLSFKNQIVNGIVYQRALLASYALFPIKAGVAEIDPYEAKVTALVRNGNFGFGFGRPQLLTKKSQAMQIKVKALPEATKPANFSGAVGDFEVKASVDSAQAKVNQPITLKVRFEGRGNAKLIDLPAMNFPSYLELYDTKKESKFYKTGRSYKEFELLLIPREAGSFEIPAMDFSLFNPASGTYEEKRTSAIALSVAVDPNATPIPSSPLAQGTPSQVQDPISKRPVNEWPREILEWRTSGSFWQMAESMPLWLALWSLGFIGLGVQARQSFGWGQKQRDLSSLIKRRFGQVNTLLGQGDWRRVGVEVTNTVYAVLGEISGEGGAHVELEKLLQKMPPSLRRELGEDLTRHMEAFQILSFAPDEAVGKLKEPSELKKRCRDVEKLLLKSVSLREGRDEVEA